MDDDKTLYLVFSNAVDGRDEEFNEWYDSTHLPEVLSTPGMISAQRYDLFLAEMNKMEGMPPPAHRYLTVYEMEGDVDTTMAAIFEAVMEGRMHLSDTLDLNTAAMTYWTPRSPKVWSKDLA